LKDDYNRLLQISVLKDDYNRLLQMIGIERRL